MDKTRLRPFSIAGLITGTFLLSRNASSTFAFDKPIHTSVVLLFTAAITIITFSRFLARYAGSSDGHEYTSVPLAEVGHPHASREPSPVPSEARGTLSPLQLRLCFFVLICAICVRVAIARQILANIQCTILTWEPLVPLVFAMWDYWTVYRHKRALYEGDSTGSVDDALEAYVSRSPYRFMCAAALVNIGSLIALSRSSGLESSYICASSLNNHWLVPLIQHLGTLTDILILYCVSRLLETQGGRSARSVSMRFRSVGFAILFSCAVLFIYGVLYTTFMAAIIERKRILEIPLVYVWSLTKVNFSASLTVLCACIAISSIGLTTTTLLTTFISVSTITTTYAWNNSYAFPPTSPGVEFFGTCLTILGFSGYILLQTLSDDNARRLSKPFGSRVPTWFHVALLTLFLLRTILWSSASASVNYHPVDLLMYDAQKAHSAYVNQTSSSRTLTEAARTYRQRYHRHPPPGFEHWYKFATDRKSIVIDDFDSIYSDLLPFWSLSPQEIRERTWRMMSNPWHDASGLSIRGGKVEASPNVMPTHYWMLEGLMKMIGNFVEFVPDMDLAFNVNDECRISVPWEDLQPMREAAMRAATLGAKLDNQFSSERAGQWFPVPEEPNQDRLMREMSWQKTFDEFGVSGCPPTSAARAQRSLDVGRLCTSCSGPQSMGAFLANWSRANDICHQPDMASLHGIYLAPSAFKASHELYPIFSQSKAHGFNDILYPSAWNYIDKAQYDPKDEFPDPPFANKNSSLFWRGATSEGFSPGNEQWKGMARQRFVHLANGVNGTAAISYPLLVPHHTASGQDRLAYTQVPLKDLTGLMHTDVSFVEGIARCGGKDCPQQAVEFAPLVDPSDFQTHWQYKYLLDLDGAGFSGRFLPFLFSHSLPFKAAVFREWWDDRITPWQHFVPLDIRGHGLWATLAYFVGLEGMANGKIVQMEAHEKAAEQIAENGRDWAEKVLRKEDMEIYFFRLLLEWGRLTDDRRDGIGYDLDVG